MSTNRSGHTLTYDYVIVGGGTAGCLLANRLSKAPDRSVLLIEAGGEDNYPWIHIPVGYLHCIGNPRTDWCYETSPTPGLSGRTLRYPRGRVLGGSSSINGMIYMRGQARDYDHWATLTQDPRWGWGHCLPYFLLHEDHWRGTDRLHQAGGEWRVEQQRLRWAILQAFQEAALEFGIPKSEDFNRGNNEGVGYFEVNQKRGFRWNAAQAFLHPVRNRSNLTVWTKSVVDTLRFDGKSAVAGLRVIRDGESLDVDAAREVILAAGAIGSPLILERSGIGDFDRLHALGLPTRHALPGVGENLQDHLQLRMVFQIQGLPTLNTRARTWWGKALIGLEYLFNRSGPMSMAPSQLGGFTRSSETLAWPDLEYHVQPLSLEAFGEPLHPFDAFTASVCHLNPSSRGSVHAGGRDLHAAPRIEPRYLSTADDQATAVRALRLTRQIVSQAALAPYRPQELKPGPDLQSDEALLQGAAAIGTTIFHPVGTCAMGAPGDPNRVLDSEFRVVGLRKLRVVDGSAMPTVTSGNTNSPILMMAERASRWILNA